MKTMSPMEEFEAQKRRITLIGIGIIAALLIAIISVSSASNQPYGDFSTARAKREEYAAELEEYQQMLEEAESQLHKTALDLDNARNELGQRKNELGLTDGEEQKTDE